MRKIRTIAALPAAYTFTGNARAATFGVDAAGALTLKCVSNFAGGTEVKFLRKSPVRICRARILSSGAPGLQAGVAKLASSLKLYFTDAGSSSPEFTLTFARWNEWEEKSVSLNMGSGESCELAVSDTGTEFTCDDFNLQEEFIGQDVVPMLELEFETDSAIDAATNEGL